MPGRPIDYTERRIKNLISSAFIVGEIRAFALPTAPAGWLEADGTAILIEDYAALAAAIYCGDSNNATAAWGYRATTDVSPTSNRSTSGTYIVLPDYRGEFLRGWDNGRGKDSGRSLHSAQVDDFAEHTHPGEADSGGVHTHTGVATSNGNHSHTYSQGSVTTNDNTTVGGAASRVLSYSNTTVATGTDGAHTHILSIDDSPTHTHTLTIEAAGGPETRPSNLAALICIRT